VQQTMFSITVISCLLQQCSSFAFRCVFSCGPFRTAEAALLAFHFDPSGFSAIDFSERMCTRVVWKHFTSLSNHFNLTFAFPLLLSSCGPSILQRGWIEKTIVNENEGG
jgi:hypothetical protein